MAPRIGRTTEPTIPLSEGTSSSSSEPSAIIPDDHERSLK
jgi:hypothetical protein